MISSHRKEFAPMSQQTRQVILDKDEDGYWIVECPSLKGCQTQGRTKEQGLSNIKEAIAGYLLMQEEDGLPVPETVNERDF
jgi:predicted RNase H-like HicB family nuclease